MPDHQFKLGQSYVVVGDRENAKKAFTKACELAPMNERYREALTGLQNGNPQGVKDR